jgi:hypothetical protein
MERRLPSRRAQQEAGYGMPDCYILSDARLAPFAPPDGDGYASDGLIVVEQGKIAFVGPAGDLPERFDARPRI